MKYKCRECGKSEVPLDWPLPDLCGKCGRERDMKEPKACPFCGVNAQWRIAGGALSKSGAETPAYWLQCAVCRARGPETEIQEMAVYEWNRRNSPNEEIISGNVPAR